MSEHYQAVYDAVRSRIHGVDASGAIESVVRDAFGNVGHQLQCVAQEMACAAAEHGRPVVVFKPEFSQDGNQFCFLFGADLQSGVAGFGDTPAKATEAFDKAWLHGAIASPVRESGNVK